MPRFALASARENWPALLGRECQPACPFWSAMRFEFVRPAIDPTSGNHHHGSQRDLRLSSPWDCSPDTGLACNKRMESTKSVFMAVYESLCVPCTVYQPRAESCVMASGLELSRIRWLGRSTHIDKTSNVRDGQISPAAGGLGYISIPVFARGWGRKGSRLVA